jgi:hypothetical protein
MHLTNASHGSRLVIAPRSLLTPAITGDIIGVWQDIRREGAVGEHKTTIRIPEELHRRAKAKAALTGQTLSEVFRRLLAGWVAEEIELPPEPEQREE